MKFLILILTLSSLPTFAGTNAIRTSKTPKVVSPIQVTPSACREGKGTVICVYNKDLMGLSCYCEGGTHGGEGISN